VKVRTSPVRLSASWLKRMRSAGLKDPKLLMRLYNGIATLTKPVLVYVTQALINLKSVRMPPPNEANLILFNKIRFIKKNILWSI
jgi:hypothetical protein